MCDKLSGFSLGMGLNMLTGAGLEIGLRIRPSSRLAA